MWTAVGDGVDGGSVDGFLDALFIWINKPHVINRRLCGSCTLHQTSARTGLSLEHLLTHLQRTAGDFSASEHFEETLKALFGSAGGCGGDVSLRDVEVVVRDLHPKLLDKFCTQREIVLIDKEGAVAVFVPLLLVGQDGRTTLCEQPAYKVHYHHHRINISVAKSGETTEIEKSEVTSQQTESSPADNPLPCESQHAASDADTVGDVPLVGLQSGAGCRGDWLRDHLLRKVGQWSFHEDLNTEVTSLRLVPLDRYNRRYNEMKNKYGPHLVNNWPESTDPQKFVYEDISIAAYLITLWEVEREECGLDERQSFVDLGCGNGLLVHLLSEEGYPGKGIDLRKRNIWDGFYGANTHLEEFTLTPSDKNLFQGYDWLIGNHSDELTPWIPVIAARSSYTCRYLVLPCCFYDFDARYRVKEHGKSQYRGYLDFVRTVGETCGFSVQEDIMRIPSTKRVCFIGKSRTYPSDEEAAMDAERTDFISSRCLINAPNPPPPGQDAHDSATDEAAWASNFQARSSIERPRNCVSLDKELTRRVVDTVFEAVLKAEGGVIQVTPDGRSWNTGGRIPLGDVVALFDPGVMKELKNECGGLQTLLRNHYHIFRVQAGCVHIRDMGSEDEEHWTRKKKLKGKRNADQDTRKTRLCYLNQNHPDGCPRDAENCRFAHGDEELRVIPRTQLGQ